jgi:hypothetical protein
METQAREADGKRPSQSVIDKMAYVPYFAVSDPKCL